MKKFITDIKTMVSLLMVGVAFVACSSDDSIIEESQQPANGKYTMTVEATKGSDDAVNSRTTRALSLDGKTLNATWAEGEEVTVYNETKKAALTGTLVAQSSGASTTLKGTLTGTIENGDQLKLKFLSPTYGTQDGTLTGSATSIDKVCDYAEATVSVTAVSGGNITTSTASFVNQQAIVKFTLKKKADNSDLEIPAATAFTVNDGTNDYTVTPTSATNVLFVAIPATSTVNLSTTVGGITYSYEKTGANLAAGNYYEIGVKLVRGTVNLANITGDTELLDGDIVTGTLGENHKISIAAGASVTLDGVNINGSGTWSSGNYAGINCLGDATIILADETTNSVKGFYQYYPGIHIPNGYTLNINGETAGTGSLTASSNGYAAGIGGGYNTYSCGNITINGGVVTATGGKYAAGIGSGYQTSCGTIIINGGMVEATAGQSGAGIGSGYSASCGAITINGGTITASGGYQSAGIGSGYNSSCGNITIENTVTRVYATKGHTLSDCIGAGRVGTCGTVTIGGVVGAISESPYTYPIQIKALSAATAEDVGKLAGQDGNIYKNAAAATSAGTTAVAKIIYVGSSTGVDAPYNHGLALALTDEASTMLWADAMTACSTTKNTNTPVIGASWMLASKDQWDTMISAAGSYTALRDGFTSVDGTNMQNNFYWSSTENDSDSSLASLYSFNFGMWLNMTKASFSAYVRACLAF